jgi:hypothetical protein
MRKGLILTLVLSVFAFGMANTADAAAPSIDDVAVFIISDLEQNAPSLDNNLFVFTDAFDLDLAVTDLDTLGVDIAWSFDYDPGTSTGNIEINGIGRLDVVGGGDPLAPGAFDLRAVSNTATFREIDASPTAGTAPFPDPAAGANGVVIGGITYNDVITDIPVSYFASDGTAFDMFDSFVYAVDNDLAGTVPDTVVSGVPTVVFTPVSLTGWTFTNGDNFITNQTTSGSTGGLQITFPAAVIDPFSAAPPALASYTGIWSNAALAEANLMANMLYLWRATLDANVALDAGANVRLRLEPAGTGSVDNSFVIVEDVPSDPGNLTVAPGMRLAYFHPSDVDAFPQQNGFAYDGVDNGDDTTGGTNARTVTLSALEAGASDPAGFFGSANANAGGTFATGGFGSWDYVPFGTFTSDGLTFFDDDTVASGMVGGNLQHTDGDGATGGAAEWSFGEFANPDIFESSAAGALMGSSWDIDGSADGGDGTAPGVRASTRYANANVSIEYVVRGEREAWDNQVGMFNTYELLWVAPAQPNMGAGMNGDDAVHAFGLFNVNGDTQKGGTLDLFAVRANEYSADDPNI